jgi:hypothetical protein
MSDTRRTQAIAKPNEESYAQQDDNSFLTKLQQQQMKHQKQ